MTSATTLDTVGMTVDEGGGGSHSHQDATAMSGTISEVRNSVTAPPSRVVRAAKGIRWMRLAALSTETSPDPPRSCAAPPPTF